MQQLSALLSKLETLIQKADEHNPNISASSAGWHIEHSLLTLNAIIGALKKSEPKDYKWKFNFIRTLILSINKIPRGKAKAPAIVQPKELFTKASLNDHLTETMKNLEALKTLHKNAHFPHPYFGQLNLKTTIKFLKLHTRHHLKIIEDIVR